MVETNRTLTLNERTRIHYHGVCISVEQCEVKTQNGEPMLGQCWPTVCDAGLTITQHFLA